MSKKPDLMAALATSGHASTSAPKAVPRTKAGSPAPITQGRDGLANVSAYLDKQFQTNLRLAKATMDIAAAEAIADALNDWFLKMNLPRVAGVAAFTRDGRQ